MPEQKRLQRYRDLDVYHRAFEAAMTIFNLTKNFPVEEKFSLVDQIRRPSRSVCSNLAEAWRKRKYPAVFRSKRIDAMQEASETQSWLEICLACNYLKKDTFDKIDQEYEGILAMLNATEKSYQKICF